MCHTHGRFENVSLPGIYSVGAIAAWPLGSADIMRTWRRAWRGDKGKCRLCSNLQFRMHGNAWDARRLEEAVKVLLSLVLREVYA